MGRPHHKKGCLSCGKLRRREDIRNKTYDVMLKDQTSKTIIRVGLCPVCFGARNSLDLTVLKTKLAASEKAFCEEKRLPEQDADVFENAVFVSLMSRADYWNKIRERFPKGPKTTSDYLEVFDAP